MENEVKTMELMLDKENDIETMELKLLKYRKKLVLEKMDLLLFDKGDITNILKYLEKKTSFKWGCLLNFNKFKEDYLINSDKLRDFIDFYNDTAYDLSELYYCGFGENLIVVDETRFHDTLSDTIRDYDFMDCNFNSFEAFVDDVYKDWIRI